MARAISDHYITDQSIKAKRSAKLDEPQPPLAIGTRVLRLYKQPPGACAKLYVNWKGVFVVKKQVDVDTYLISLENDGRKKFIVHRRHLRPIGTYLGSYSGAEGNPEEKCQDTPTPLATNKAVNSSDESKNKNNESSDSELRRSERLKSKVTDFKEFFDDVIDAVQVNEPSKEKEKSS